MLDLLLQKQGLSDKKITIYKLLMELGEQPASFLAKKVSLNRSSCYQHLEHLLQLGLISRIIKNNVTYFAANDVLGVLDNLKSSYSKDLKEIETLQMTLHADRRKQQRKDHSSKAHFFSGSQNLKQLLSQSLPAGQHTNKVFISASSFFDSEWIAILTEQLNFLSTTKTSTNLITVAKTNFKHPKYTDQKKLSAHFDIGLDLIILKDKVVLLSPSEEFGVQIDSRSVAAATSKIYDLFWKIAKNN